MVGIFLLKNDYNIPLPRKKSVKQLNLHFYMLFVGAPNLSQQISCATTANLSLIYYKFLNITTQKNKGHTNLTFWHAILAQN